MIQKMEQLSPNNWYAKLLQKMPEVQESIVLSCAIQESLENPGTPISKASFVVLVNQILKDIEELIPEELQPKELLTEEGKEDFREYFLGMMHITPRTLMERLGLTIGVGMSLILILRSIALKMLESGHVPTPTTLTESIVAYKNNARFLGFHVDPEKDDKDTVKEIDLFMNIDHIEDLPNGYSTIKSLLDDASMNDTKNLSDELKKARETATTTEEFLTRTKSILGRDTNKNVRLVTIKIKEGDRVLVVDELCTKSSLSRAKTQMLLFVGEQWDDLKILEEAKTTMTVF